MSKKFLMLTTACIFFSCTAKTTQNGEVNTSVVNNKPEQVSDETETQNPTPEASEEQKLLADIQSLASKLDGTCESAADWELFSWDDVLFVGVSNDTNEFSAYTDFGLYCIDPVLTETEEELYELSDYIFFEDNDISDETKDQADEIFVEIDDRLYDLEDKFKLMITITPGQGITRFDDESIPSAIDFTVEASSTIKALYRDQEVEVPVIASDYTNVQVERGEEIYNEGIPANNVRACADCHESAERAPNLASLQICSDLSINGAINNAKFTEDENYELPSYCSRELAPFHANNLSEQDTQAVIAFLRLINY